MVKLRSPALPQGFDPSCSTVPMFGLLGSWRLVFLISTPSLLRFGFVTVVEDFFGCDKRLCSCALLFFFLLFLFLPLFIFFGTVFGVFGEEILSTFDLEINLALLLGWREWSVDLSGLIGDSVGDMSLAESLLLEVWKKSVPTFVFELWIFGKFSFYHEFLHMVNGMDVVHAVLNDPSDFLEPFEPAHCTDCVTLDEDITAGEEFKRFQSGSVRSE